MKSRKNIGRKGKKTKGKKPKSKNQKGGKMEIPKCSPSINIKNNKKGKYNPYEDSCFNVKNCRKVIFKIKKNKKYN